MFRTFDKIGGCLLHILHIKTRNIL